MILFLKVIMAVAIVYTVIRLCRIKVVFYKNRPKTLRQIVYSLQNFSNQMVFSNELLPDIVHNMSKENYPISALWQQVNSELQSGNTFENSLEKALQKLQGQLSLADDDLSCLKVLSTQLGQSDLENRLKIIKITMDKILLLEKQSEQEKKQQVKLWNMLGVLGGLTIVILLW